MRILILVICFSFSCTNAFAQVKKRSQDGKQDRTLVIKEEGSNDFDILDAEFGDAKIGQVIRITTEKPPPQQKEKPVKQIVEPVVPPKATQKKTPPPVKKAKVQEPLPPKTWKPTPSINYGDWKWKRVKKPRRKKYSKRRRASCYSF